MKGLSSKEIREKFIQYFQNNDHLKISASSIVPKDDPTLLYINSGMAPLKKYFLAKAEPPCPRLVNYQPCIRTKDIDDVGDRHHLTMFEMLGSWSIGDYYKEKAVELAYGLLVNELGFDPNKLYVTCYEGDKKLGLPADNESAVAWEKVGMAKDHIIMLGEDNFWGPAGDSGPCGPCTEVFYDCGEKFGPQWKAGDEFITTSRYIEIWNAGVFMEFNKSKEGNFSSLPLKSVDTGSGLERMEMIMNGYDNVYQTGLLKPLLDDLKSQYKNLNENSLYMMTDHLRSSVMILSEGVNPSNEGQGYIPRRLLRKCLAAVVSSGVQKIDFSPFIEKIVELMGSFYPSLKSNKDFILHQIIQETTEFLPIVKKGIDELDFFLKTEITSDLGGPVFKNYSSSDLKQKKEKIYSGKLTFELVTTHGVPFEVIKGEVESRGFKVNEEEYKECDKKHREVSRVVSYGSKGGDSVDIEGLFGSLAKTEFMGYSKFDFEGQVIGLIYESKKVDKVTSGQEFLLAVDKTSFYGESGGQAGDKGEIEGPSCKGLVRDTQKVGNIFVHFCKLTEGEISLKDNIILKVDKETRLKTRRNHSATHLLHAALRKVVGKHAIQKGSQVNPERLRFDFQNNQGLKEEELDKIEFLVNSWIRQNDGGVTRELSYNEALEDGAIGLFGEAYGDKVRVVSFGADSKELCGGTHVETTGEIGLMMILSETSVAKGIRRIEAVTGEKAVHLVQERNRILKESSKLLNAKLNAIPESIKNLQKKQSELKKASKSNQPKKETNFSMEKTLDVKGIKVFIGRMDADRDTLKEVGDQLLDKGAADVVSLIGVEEDSIRSFVWVKKDLSKKIKAGDLLKEMLLPIGGRGGGKPHFAQGGGAGSDKVSLIFDLFENGTLVSWIEKKL